MRSELCKFWNGQLYVRGLARLSKKARDVNGCNGEYAFFDFDIYRQGRQCFPRTATDAAGGAQWFEWAFGADWQCGRVGYACLDKSSRPFFLNNGKQRVQERL